MPVFRLLRLLFLSTPSARRATEQEGTFKESKEFLSTPSARRATYPHPRHCRSRSISIHALREEGDFLPRWRANPERRFLSTPSARRATSPGSHSRRK